VAPVIEFPVSYTASGAGNTEFTASRVAPRDSAPRFDRIPSGTTYKLVLHV